jgi:carboxymethylenebutenolidase
MADHQHAMMSVPYRNHGIPVYRACAASEPRPAIILIHEVWGLTDHIKDVAERFCDEGYITIAPDLMANTDMAKVLNPKLQKVMFDEKERPKHQVEIRTMMAPLGSPDFAAETIARLKAVFDYLQNDANVSKVFVVGFCFGGTYSFGLAANQRGLAGAIPFYGHGEHYIDKFSGIDCPVMAFYGENDAALNEHIPAIEKAMKDAEKRFSYKIYPGVRHAFFNDTNPLTYNSEAAKDAWSRTLDFLAEN